MKKSIKFPFFTVIMILLASSCIQWIATPVHAESQVDNWSMFNHDLAHTGSSTSIAPTTNQTLWTFTTGGAVESSPAVVNGIAYVGSDDGYVYALNAANGALIWNYSTGGPVQSSPAVVDGVVYVGGFHSHAVFALNAYTGALVWSSPTNSVYPNEISSTAVANGLVYVDVYNTGGASGGELYAFNASTGNLAWKYDAGVWLSSSPAVYGGKVYFGTTAGVVVALDATSGNPSWTYSIRLDGSNSSIGSAYPLSCALSVGDGLVYVGTVAQTVQALNPSSGAFVWSGNIMGGVSSSTAAVANGVVYVSTTLGGTYGNLQYGGVTALNAKSGARLWNTTIGSIQYSSPSVADGVVFVGSDDGPSMLKVIDGHSIYALDATTGATIWTYTTGGAVYSSPAVAYGVVYVGSNDGKVYAIGTSQNTIPSPSPSPTATPPNKAPKITVASPENKTYYTTDIPLNFSVNEPASMRYKLDNQTTTEISDNTTLTGLSYGQHNLTVYATDIAGNTGVSETINFTIALEPEPFPATLIVTVTVIVAVIGIGLLVYFKKRKH